MEKNLFDLEAMAQSYAYLLKANSCDGLITLVLANHGVNLRLSMVWDRLNTPLGIALEKPDGWIDICDFVGDREIYFCESEARKIWRFQNGFKLREFLSEIPILDIYVFDEAANFLICFNDHGHIIVWGNADDWLNELEKKSVNSQL